MADLPDTTDDDTDDTDDTDDDVVMLVGELIHEQLCTPYCLLAAEDGECQCVCLGATHGALTLAVVHLGVPNRRPRRLEDEPTNKLNDQNENAKL